MASRDSQRNHRDFVPNGVCVDDCPVVGAITDVGTILIQVKTAEGGLRVVCPWELVKTRDGDHGPTQVACGC